MAILGNNNKGASSSFGVTGIVRAAQATLATASILNELHGWFTGGAGEQWILVIYADNGSAAPGARVAYTAALTAASGDIELSQSGFSVSLPAGNYWLGWTANTGSSQKYYWDTGGTTQCQIRNSGGTFNPPNDPMGANTNDNRNLSVWAVVVPASTTWNGSSTVSLTDTVTTAGTRVGVTVHGASVVTLTATVTTVSRSVTSHGVTAVAETVTVTTTGHIALSQLILAPRIPGSLTLVPRPPDSLVLTPR